jgi:phosphoribosyl 1,2-cyclic phosphodiesterase
MIQITPLASSSAGNAYHVTDGETALLLDAGLSFKEIQKGVNYKVSQLAGCLITHHHGDHIKGLKGLLDKGVDVYISQGTINELGYDHYRFNVVRAFEDFTIGTWTIIPFDVQHDVDEPLGYLLINKLGETLLFATDTYYIKYKFSGITNMLIECNYSQELVKHRIVDEPDEQARRALAARYKRLLKSHMSLENLKDFMRSNDLSKLKEVWLIHLSDGNSDEALFKQEIQKLTGVPVYVADK